MEMSVEKTLTMDDGSRSFLDEIGKISFEPWLPSVSPIMYADYFGRI